MAKRAYNYSNLAEAFGRATERNIKVKVAVSDIDAEIAAVAAEERVSEFAAFSEPVSAMPASYAKPRSRLMLLDKKTEEAVINYMPDRDSTQSMADFFSHLGDPTRLRIISALSISGMCVGDLAAVLEMNQTTLSHQLHNLKRGGLVKSARQGKVVFYSIKNKVLQDILLLCLEFL